MRENEFKENKLNMEITHLIKKFQFHKLPSTFVYIFAYRSVNFKNMFKTF